MTAWREMLRVLFVLLLAAWASRANAAGSVEATDSPDGVPQRLVLAVDGVPYDLFAEMQRQGLFADFHPVARMVAPFPSLSDVSFAAIGGSPPPEGYQIMRFDPASNRLVGNTLKSLTSAAHPDLPADSDDHGSWHRMIGYVAAYHVALFDLRAISRELMRSRKSTFVAYLEGSDAILHVEGREGAIKFLRKLDTLLGDLQAQVRAKTGRELLVDIVSDHGSTLVKGRSVQLRPALKACGFRRSHRLASDKDVAYAYAGIIASVAISVAPDQVRAVSRCLAEVEGVDLVAVDGGDRVHLYAARGEAEVMPVGGRDEAYRYRATRGDPLNLLGGAPGERVFKEGDLFQQSRDGAYPDPLRRLWRGFHGAVQHPTPILLSLADGWEAGNTTMRGLAELRGRAGTHGSLTRSASLGILASNWRPTNDMDCWRTHDFLFGENTVLAMRDVTKGWPMTGRGAARGP